MYNKNSGNKTRQKKKNLDFENSKDTENSISFLGTMGA
jgi:hypothetical protein